MKLKILLVFVCCFVCLSFFTECPSVIPSVKPPVKLYEEGGSIFYTVTLENTSAEILTVRITWPDGDKDHKILFPNTRYTLPAFDIGLGLGPHGIVKYEVKGYSLSLYAKFTQGRLDFTWYAP